MARILFEFTPGLWAVFKGQLSLVGVAARPAAAIERLPSDWKALYLKTKAGLITEAAVAFGTHVTEDELHSSEAYYVAKESFSYDLRLLGRYVSDLAGRSRELHPGVRAESNRS